MSLRSAVIARLQASHICGGRVYQAFLAPAKVDQPYVTVKLAGMRGDPLIGFAGTQPIELRSYDRQGTFAVLDGIEQAVIAALRAGPIACPQSGMMYRLAWVPGGATDFVEDDRGLIGRLTVFEAAVLRE